MMGKEQLPQENTGTPAHPWLAEFPAGGVYEIGLIAVNPQPRIIPTWK